MKTCFPSDLELSILIINFNGIFFLGPCLDSIRKNVSLPYEIIVVDNASNDESINFLSKNYPSVRVIESPLNLGFTGGNNLAAKIAKGRYLLLLNSDTVICSRVDPLIYSMDSKPDVGALGCRLIYGDGRQQESVGYMPSVLSLVFSWTPLKSFFSRSAKFRMTVHYNSYLYNQKYIEVDWVSGAFLLTRAKLWHQLGGFDAQYFMYMEDTDYCRRVQESGNKVSYSSSCKVIHFEGASRSWIGERAVLNSTDSYLVYINKYYGMIAVVLLRVLLSLVFIARSLACFITSIVGIDTDGYEKSRAYRRAALKLLFRFVY